LWITLFISCVETQHVVLWRKKYFLYLSENELLLCMIEFFIIKNISILCLF